MLFQSEVSAADVLSALESLIGAKAMAVADASMKRIYIAGCARSGTTMLCHMMNGFSGAYVHENEAPYAILDEPCPGDGLVIAKRTSSAYKSLTSMPADIELIYMVRHPYDVLTSTLLSENFHVNPRRWLKEAQALERVLACRENVLIIRYEDLVRDPDAHQMAIANCFGLTPARPFSSFHLHGEVSERRALALRGLRAPDTASVGRWRSDPKRVEYCTRLSAVLGQPLARFAERFSYDLTI